MTISAKKGVVRRSTPVSTSARRKVLASDSTTEVPDKPRRKLATARLTGSGSVVAHRKVTGRASTSKTDTSERGSRTHRLGVTNPLLGKDHTGLEECSPVLLHPRPLLELTPHFPRRAPNDESSSYNNGLTDQINTSLSYAALCSREPGVSLSRTQLAPSNLAMPTVPTVVPTVTASPGYRIGQVSVGIPHSSVGTDHVPSAARAPRSSSSTLDTEGWPVSSGENMPSKHHKASVPMRLHTRIERPLDFDHVTQCWGQSHEWDQRGEMRAELHGEGQQSGTRPLAANLVGPGVVTVGNSANSLSPGICHHHFPRAGFSEQEAHFFFQENSPLNIDWDNKTSIPRTPSFNNNFQRNYSSLQVLPKRSFHQVPSPQLQEPYLSTSPSAITSRSGFACNQPPPPNFNNTFTSMTPTCCIQTPQNTCSQQPPLTPTTGVRTSASLSNPQHNPNHNHSHFGACTCVPQIHHNCTSNVDPHYHQFNQSNHGPVSASGSNTSANMTTQMHNNPVLRRAVRPPRTMLINAAAAGAHITSK